MEQFMNYICEDMDRRIIVLSKELKRQKRKNAGNCLFLTACVVYLTYVACEQERAIRKMRKEIKALKYSEEE